jgi:hypothetical protein
MLRDWTGWEAMTLTLTTAGETRFAARTMAVVRDASTEEDGAAWGGVAREAVEVGGASLGAGPATADAAGGCSAASA